MPAQLVHYRGTGITFDYREIAGRGPGPRWIEIQIRRVVAPSSYKLDPNPHLYGKRYINNAAQVYQDLAKALANYYIDNPDHRPNPAFPPSGRIQVRTCGMDFTLT